MFPSLFEEEYKRLEFTCTTAAALQYDCRSLKCISQILFPGSYIRNYLDYIPCTIMIPGQRSWVPTAKFRVLGPSFHSSSNFWICCIKSLHTGLVKPRSWTMIILWQNWWTPNLRYDLNLIQIGKPKLFISTSTLQMFFLFISNK